MPNRKSIKERGKIRLSEYFKKFEKGDKIAVKKEKSVNSNFAKRISGRTGVIEEKRGSSYVIKINEFNKEKLFIIPPIHLKRIKMVEK